MTLLWQRESLAWLFSVLFLIVMVILLIVYDEHEIFDWHGVTLNAVVSLLSTASKAALLFAVAESVGQWKWILFADRSRPLLDLERIDSASRGLWGGTRVLCSPRRMSLLRLGALITVVAIALDPFAQQLVQYEQRSRSFNDTSTTIVRAQRYSAGNEYQVFGEPLVYATPAFSMQSAILYGLAQPYGVVSKQTTFNCAGGNCTWPPFQSLAVCSGCTNLTANLTPYKGFSQLFTDLDQSNGVGVSQAGTSFALPNGLFISNFDGMAYERPNGDPDQEYGWVYLTSYGTGNASRTNSFKDNDSLIWAMSFIKMPQPADASLTWPHIPLDATECALFYCVKQYESEVTNSTLHEEQHVFKASKRVPESWQPIQNNVLDVTVNRTLKNSLLFNNQTSVIQRSDLAFAGGYNVSQAAVDGISSYFQNQFRNDHDFDNSKSTEGIRNSSTTRTIDQFTLNGYYISNGAKQFNPAVMENLFESTSIRNTFHSLARSMTNTIRADSDNNPQERGISKVMATYYRIEWPWITLHATLIVLGFAFFLITIFETRKMRIPVFKNNVLAPLSQSSKLATSVVGLNTTRELENAASKVFVQLFTDKRPMPIDGEAIELMRSHPP